MAKDEKMSDVEQLISMGKERGFLTYDELNHALPEDVVSSEEMDNIMSMFGEMDIDIVDTEEARFRVLLGEEGKEEADLEAEAAGRTDDPVRLYLKEMGNVSLLSREGEVAIAKRIEEGKQEIHSIIFGLPFTIQELGDLAERLRSNTVTLQDVVVLEDEMEEEGGFAEIHRKDKELLKAQVLEQIQKIRKTYRDLLQQQNRLQDSKLKEASRERIRKRLQEIRSRLLHQVEELNLHPKYIEELGRRLKEYNEMVQQAETEMAKVAQALGCEPDVVEQVLLEAREGRREVADLEALEQCYQQAREQIQQVEQKVCVPAEELKRAVRTLEIAELKVRMAKSDLIEANLRLVVSIAKKYTNRGLQFLDLIQEGNIGLMKAVEKFEYKRGYKFSTYATWWIRQAITRAIADQARTIRIPVHMIETINKLIRTSRQLVQELGREPTPEEIAQHMGMPVEKVRKVLKIAKEPISLETPVGEEEDSHLGDFIEDKKAISPLESAIKADLHKQINDVLKTLTPREEKVLRLRFGIGEATDHTLEEVGRQFAVTRERIRQIEAKALRKLRHPSRAKRLKSFAD